MQKEYKTISEISGPLVCKSWAIHDEILPRVVVGELKVDDFFVAKNSL